MACAIIPAQMCRQVTVSHVLVMPTAVGLALCSLVASLVACSGMLKTPEQADIKPWPEIRSDFRVETLRASLYEYSITFAAEVDFTATSIEQRTTDATVRRNALLWRIRAIPEMRKACSRIEPVGGLVDAWTLSRQIYQLFSEGAGAGAFGTFQPEVVAVSRRLVDQLREIGGSIVDLDAFEQPKEHSAVCALIPFRLGAAQFQEIRLGNGLASWMGTIAGERETLRECRRPYPCERTTRGHRAERGGKEKNHRCSCSHEPPLFRAPL